LVLSRKVMGAFAAEAQAAGINYIGSCCGSMPVHVREMARALGKAPVDRTWRVDYAEPMSANEFYKHGTKPRSQRPLPEPPEPETARLSLDPSAGPVPAEKAEQPVSGNHPSAAL